MDTSIPRQDVVDAVLAFVNAWSWDEKKRIVDAYFSELASIDAELVFTNLTAHHQGDPDTIRLLDDHRKLLERVSLEGIDAAFADRLLPVDASRIPPEQLARLRANQTVDQFFRLIAREPELRRVLLEPVLMFVNARSWTAKQDILLANQELLLTDAAEYTLESSSNELGKYVDVALHLELLRRSRREGIDAAFKEFVGQMEVEEATRQEPADPRMEEIQTIIRELVNPRRPEELLHRQELCRRALELVDREIDSSLWAFFHLELGQNLVEDLSENYADNIEQAIDHYLQALEVGTREAYPDLWATIQSSLGEAYQVRIKGNREENLEQAIHCLKEVLEARTREASPGDWAMAHNNLASAYSLRMRGEPAENFMEAAAHYEFALEVFTREEFPFEWASIQANLGTLYAVEDTDVGDHDSAIAHSKQALEVFDQNRTPVQWAAAHENLGHAYFGRLSDDYAASLEHAIAHYQRALEVYGRDSAPHRWALIQASLGDVYVQRVRGERAENIEQSIRFYYRALEVHTQDDFPNEWADVQRGLGDAYRQRLTGWAASNIERAIQYYEQALTVHTAVEFPHKWADLQADLGKAHMTYAGPDRDVHVERAIEYLEQSLKLSPTDESKALVLANLGAVYTKRLQGNQADNQHQAIHYYQRALSSLNKDTNPQVWALVHTNLAIIYYEGEAADRTTSLRQAFSHCQLALETATPEVDPAAYRRNIMLLGHLHMEVGEWDQALRAYEATEESARELMAGAYTGIGRRAEVAETSGLFERSAYCLLQLHRPAEALVHLERGKSRLLADALALSEASLQVLPEDERRFIIDAREEIELLEVQSFGLETFEQPIPFNAGNSLLRARERLNRALDAIRQVRPFALPQGLDLRSILALSPPDGGLIVPIVTHQGSAVIVLPSGIQSVGDEHVLWLNEFSNKDLDNFLFDGFQGESSGSGELGLLPSYARHLEQNTFESFAAWQAVVESITSRLWDQFMGPVHEHLVSLGLVKDAPLSILTTGRLAMLPIHAAWRHVDGTKRAILDDYTVSFAPNASALHTCKLRLAALRPGKPTLLAIIDPTGDLRYAEMEGQRITALFDPEASVVLQGANATQDAIVREAPRHSHVHFACHGLFNWIEVMYSGLTLSDNDHFLLSEIMSELRLENVRLVTLSACETGMGEIIKVPDEYLGLPGGFIQAGTPAVISTLWAVTDLSTSLLMEQFFIEHLSGASPAEALRRSQQWLRSVTADEIAGLFSTGHHHGFGRPAMVTQDSATWRRFAAMAPDSHPFESPVYWGAFGLCGM